MSDIRAWLEKGTKSAARMPKLLPILIRQAQTETPITYGDAAAELGVHHRAIHHIAGYIGFTLAAVAAKRGWKNRPPPPLHALIVNSVSRLPGRGINGFMSDAYGRAKTRREKLDLLKSVYASARSYAHWRELGKLLSITIDDIGSSESIEKARKSSGRGGEGKEHQALKEFVRKNPHIVGLAKGSEHGLPEELIASGDRIDVLFKRRNLRLAVEVKSHISSEGDLLRGVFQCSKYREVLLAEAAIENRNLNIKALLIIGKPATRKVIEAANLLGISIKEIICTRKIH